MIIYNVTINVEDSNHEKWLHWMNEVHIPEVLATGKFLEAKMTRVLVEEEMGGTTYSIQFLAKDKETLNRYYAEDAAELRQKTSSLFGNSLVAFRTELELVSEHRRHLTKPTEYFFSYGSLQDFSIQQTLLGKNLKGENDVLHGYSIANEKIADQFPIAVKSEDSKDKIPGTLYLLTDQDMSKIDIYEGPAYMRVKLPLESKKMAWVYVKNEESTNGSK